MKKSKVVKKTKLIQVELKQTTLYSPAIKFKNGQIQIMGAKFDTHEAAVIYGAESFDDLSGDNPPRVYGFVTVSDICFL